MTSANQSEIKALKERVYSFIDHDITPILEDVSFLIEAEDRAQMPFISLLLRCMGDLEQGKKSLLEFMAEIDGKTVLNI